MIMYVSDETLDRLHDLIREQISRINVQKDYIVIDLQHLYDWDTSIIPNDRELTKIEDIPLLINGLEHILSNEFNFTITDSNGTSVICTAKKDMTWGEWFYGDYSAEQIEQLNLTVLLDYNMGIMDSNNKILCCDGEIVNLKDTVISDRPVNYVFK